MDVELSSLGKRLGEGALSLGPVILLEDVLLLCDASTSDEGDAYEPILDGVLRDEDRFRLLERTESCRRRGRGKGRLSKWPPPAPPVLELTRDIIPGAPLRRLFSSA
eukprot:CAMPEP_0185263084 /NCGR_PEP_ID=MMETSP1359-20130426/11070_1 /TAXON_ID=552665 /ORGANISM="Bigelowiella longifila, Strain CCMP242" /LENGTH=106 /DNA_ID=CAMNT_0027850201 /DNA_START=181 /DNA_END=501 /DNA_ORIENTATION=-